MYARLSDISKGSEAADSRWRTYDVLFVQIVYLYAEERPAVIIAMTSRSPGYLEHPSVWSTPTSIGEALTPP